MLTEVMRHYHLRRPPVDVGFFETDHHQQMTRDLIAAIQGGRLIALTAVIGSGKTALARRLRDSLDKEGRVIVSRSLTLDKAKITVPLADRRTVLRSVDGENGHDIEPVGATRAGSAGAIPQGQETGRAVRR
jgi:type II secretory pathway predicted ATPase ExeA